MVNWITGIVAGLIIAAFIIIGIATVSNTSEYVVTVTGKERVVTQESSKYIVFAKLSSGATIVFENTDSMYYGKWNSSDIYSELEKGKTYKVSVYGYRVPFLSMYENIIKAEVIK